MFTVMIRNVKNCRENLYSANSVEYDKTRGLNLQASDGRGFHFSFAENENDLREVFVMNTSGQTVARYSL